MTDKIANQALNVLCPLHVKFDADGKIVNVGPTLAKLRPDFEFLGKGLFDVFDVKRPRGLGNFEDVCRYLDTPLHVTLFGQPTTPFKAVMARSSYGYVLNLSFGFAIVDAVANYGLSNADFAPTDLTIEMLYLVEAKSAAMEESRNLNQRLQGAKIAAEEQAFTDTLTGLKNRRALDHILARLIASREPFALMQLDLDYFKSVNDQYGHAAGDHVLQKVAKILVDETRTDDTIARVGGDEFVLVFPRAEVSAALHAMAGRIIKKLEEPVPFEDVICKISGSAGSTLSCNYASPSAELMMADADKALYASKKAGRGRHTPYSSDLDALDTSVPTGPRGAAHPNAVT